MLNGGVIVTIDEKDFNPEKDANLRTNVRVTIVIPSILVDRVKQHHDKENPCETLSSFYTRAIVNQLEKEGDYETREILENLFNAEEEDP